MKQNKPQSDAYTVKSDKADKAKPVGKRYTDKLAKKLGKRPYATPTKKDVDKYLGNGVYDEKRKDKSDKKPSKKFAGGGKIKQNKPQSDAYTVKSDKADKAKPVGKRYTDKLAKKLGKRPYATPTKKDIDKFLGKGVYDEKRKDKSDKKPSKKFEHGGDTAYVEISVEEMKNMLGREKLNYPHEFIDGVKYCKCFLRPFYYKVNN